MSQFIEKHVLDRYEVKNLLGSGAYGYVWAAIDRINGEKVALKKIFDAFSNDVDAQRSYRQICILKAFKHPNIIAVKEVIQAYQAKDIYMVFEPMESDLHNVIGLNILQKEHIQSIGYQIMIALKYLHSGQVIHRDLKPSNILLDSSCNVKVCDFGLARSLVTEEDTVQIVSKDVATRWYRSPQMLLGIKYGPPTDVWSLGCMLAEIYLEEPLFEGETTINQLVKIFCFWGQPSQQTVEALGGQSFQSLISSLNLPSQPNQSVMNRIPIQVRPIILAMVDCNPNTRMTIDEALSQSFFSAFRKLNDQITYKGMYIPTLDDNIICSVETYQKHLSKLVNRWFPQQSTPALEAPAESQPSRLFRDKSAKSSASQNKTSFLRPRENNNIRQSSKQNVKNNASLYVRQSPPKAVSLTNKHSHHDSLVSNSVKNLTIHQSGAIQSMHQPLSRKLARPVKLDDRSMHASSPNSSFSTPSTIGKATQSLHKHSFSNIRNGAIKTNSFTKILAKRAVE